MIGSQPCQPCRGGRGEQGRSLQCRIGLLVLQIVYSRNLDLFRIFQAHLHHVMHEITATKEVHHKEEPLIVLEGGMEPCQEPGWSEMKMMMAMISCHL